MPFYECPIDKAMRCLCVNCCVQLNTVYCALDCHVAARRAVQRCGFTERCRHARRVIKHHASMGQAAARSINSVHAVQQLLSLFALGLLKQQACRELTVLFFTVDILLYVPCCSA